MIEQLLNVIAPHLCVICRKEGQLLCNECNLTLPAAPDHCLLCGMGHAKNGLCDNCQDKSAIDNILAVTRYQGSVKAFVHAIKFERAQAGTHIMAKLMGDKLSDHAAGIEMITYAPTANTRRRIRGYDQAALMARYLGRERKVPYSTLLYRHGKSRQVGASRDQRVLHMEEAFTVRSKDLPARVLLIDDVITTGATLEAAARTLKQAGVKYVMVAVFAAVDP